VYRLTEDPFETELLGNDMSYEQNPSDPTKPQRTLRISDIATVSWE